MPPGPKPGTTRTPTGKGAVSRPISFTAEHNDLIEEAIRNEKIGPTEFVRRAIDGAAEKVSWESVEIGIKAAIQETMNAVASSQTVTSSQIAEAIPQDHARIIAHINNLVSTTIYINLMLEGVQQDITFSENQTLRDSATGDLKGEWLALKELGLRLLRTSEDGPWMLWWIGLQKLAAFQGFYPIQWGCVRPGYALRIQAFSEVFKHVMHEYGHDDFCNKMLEMHERRHEIIDTYWPEDDIGDDRPKDRER